MDKPPLSGGRSTADGTATTSFNELQLRKDRPFETTKVQLHTAISDENGLHKTVSLHQVTAVPRPESNIHAPVPRPAQQSSALQKTPKALRQLSRRAADYVTENTYEPAEYGVKRKTVYRDKGQ